MWHLSMLVHKEVLFTRGTTTSKLGSAGFAPGRLQKGDEIWISPAEHHSNVVPWQQWLNKQGRLTLFFVNERAESIKAARTALTEGENRLD